VRTGYGISGNLGGIDSYNSLQRFMPVGIVPNNGMPTVTLGYVANVNPNLKWETRSSNNIGVDLGLFNNRLVMTAEYYYSKTRNMLGGKDTMLSISNIKRMESFTGMSCLELFRRDDE
jgi:hypothetical protein